MEQIEIWKNIKNSHYSISNFGRVKNDKTNYILKGRKSKNGYLQVSIAIGNKKQANKYIHRLVCEYFIENPYNKRCINHKDYNKEKGCALAVDYDKSQVEVHGILKRNKKEVKNES